MEIFQLLDKSNCRKCNRQTCLAFAAAVFQGQKQLEDCPKLDAEVIAKYSGKPPENSAANEQEVAQKVRALQKRIRSLDLAAAADALGGTFSRNQLTLKILGKDFHIDTQGNLSSDIHMHAWLTIPVLTYVLEGKGGTPTGAWVPLRELKNGGAYNSLFVQRVEKPLRRVADAYTELFEDMIQLFNGKEIEKQYAADISLVLHPLPKVPILICYWKAEDGMASSLHLFFDAGAEYNLNIGAIFALGAGLVRMFEKIALRHGIHENS